MNKKNNSFLVEHQNTADRFWEIFFPGLLVLILGIIGVFNYTQGTWLIGWDTLLPELDFGGQFKNLLFGAWRQDQGLGAVAAHSHMSELPRVAILWLFNLFLPANLLRSSFIFLCFILGPMGIYFLLRRVLSDRLKLGKKAMITVVLIPSFLAAIFYIFNLATLQQFYVVFEMFAVQYASLGWLFLSLYLSLTRRRWRDFTAYFLISFLASSMAYASQLYLAYALGLGLFLLVFWLLDKNKIKTGWAILAVIGLTMVANFYWLLPTGYFLLTEASTVPASSQINQVFSTESFLQNQAYGNLAETLIFKNFLFNWQQFDFTGNNFVPMMGVWEKYWAQNSWWQIWPYIASGLGLIGLVGAMLQVIIGAIKIKNKKSVSYLFQKNRVAMALMPVFLLALAMIMNSNPPLIEIFDWLREKLPIFKEGLRTPYTKFVLLLLFSLAVGWGFLFSILAEKITFWRQKKWLQIGMVILIVGNFVGFGWPFFQGQLINPLIKKNIPDEYFTFWYFAQENLPTSSRIALLPAETYSAWEYHTWGYEGAGFIWFGLKQPFLTRDFDRWNVNNEDFYRQFSTAWHRNDVETVAKILEKYQVSYLLMDESLFRPKQTEQNEEALRQGREILAELGYEKIFEQGSLTLYKINEGNWSVSFISVPEKFYYLVNQEDQTREAVVAELGYENWADFEKAQNPPTRTTYYPLVQLTRDSWNEDDIFLETNRSDSIQSASTQGDSSQSDFTQGDSTQSASIQSDSTQSDSNLDGISNQESFNIDSLAIISNYLETSFWLPAGHYQLTLPASTWTVEANHSQWYLTSAKISYLENGELEFNFEPNLTLKNTAGEVLAMSPQIENFTWLVYSDNEEKPQSLYLDFNDQQLKIARGQSERAFFWLPIETDLELKVFAEDDVMMNETGQKTVNLTAVKTLMHEVENWSGLVAEETISLPENTTEQKIMVLTPVLENKYDLSDVAKQPVLTCESGEESTDISRELVEGNLIYKAENNQSLCGQLNLSTAGFNLAKIVALKTANYTGRSLKVSFFNQRTNLTDVEKLMPEGEELKTSWLTLLPNRDEGYILNWNNRSFGHIASKNALATEIKTWDFNLSDLLKIAVTPAGSERNSLATDNSGLEYEIERAWPTYYRLKINNQTGGERMIVLGQSYEKGWRGKIIEKSEKKEELKISNHDMNTGQKEAEGDEKSSKIELTHGKYNDWANAWLVPEGEMTLEIYYWPQVLEWLGLAMLGITSLGLAMAGVIFWLRRR